MTTVRAVENGLSLVRPTENGLSTVVDPFGRVVLAEPDGPPGDNAIAVDVPIYELDTLYPWLGSWVPYSCLGGLVLIVLLAWRGPNRLAMR